MRPKKLCDYIGQKHLVGEGAILRQMIETGNLSSFILWGPPGVGKTTLARIIANELERPFYTLSAVTSGVKEVREVIDKARQSNHLMAGGLFTSAAATNIKPSVGGLFDTIDDQPLSATTVSNREFTASPILFIDEIHRFSKSQQDSLLGAVEEGIITLIGATTENPSFEVITPLLSRCAVYVLKPLGKEDLLGLVERTLKTDSYLKQKKIDVRETESLLRYSGGDARKLLNILDLVTGVAGSYDENYDCVIDNDTVTKQLQQNPVAYDKDGEMHYDIISAFIKSIRGSDPDAAIYWLARMVAAGEDPKFIARRLVISASEDIGLANPNALLIANSAFDAVSKIGWPEGRIPLAMATVYLATSQKSNSAYMAINDALAMVEKTGNLPVPLHLRNAPTKLMEELGYGEEYKYAHDYQNHFVKQQYMPDELIDTQFWHIQGSPAEQKMAEWMKHLWEK
ncbi:MAG: replication-associated recombination protein A [Paludibacteraceae bacterium]|nr:replication-associated recombination protein A [Paludibacteraceae bacterium]